MYAEPHIYMGEYAEIYCIMCNYISMGYKVYILALYITSVFVL